MANVPVKINEEITAPDTADNIVKLVPADIRVLNKPITLAYITVTAGTIQFSVGENIVAGHKAWPVNSKVLLSFTQDLAEIHFKAASNTDKFVITV